jgi:hypothetical protein
MATLVMKSAAPVDGRGPDRVRDPSGTSLSR